jgi:hypothetical protein
MLENKGDAAEFVVQVKYQKKECEILMLSSLVELYDNPNPAATMKIIKWAQAYDRIDKAFNRV